jgi:hypothetical protein
MPLQRARLEAAPGGAWTSSLAHLTRTPCREPPRALGISPHQIRQAQTPEEFSRLSQEVQRYIVRNMVQMSATTLPFIQAAAGRREGMCVTAPTGKHALAMRIGNRRGFPWEKQSKESRQALEGAALGMPGRDICL